MLLQSLVNPTDGNVFLRFLIQQNITIPSTHALLVHDIEIVDGIEITIEDGGELLVL